MSPPVGNRRAPSRRAEIRHGRCPDRADRCGRRPGSRFMVLTMFDTQTMAELYVKQGLTDQALEIYRRLLAAADDPATCAQYEARIADLAELRTALPANEAPTLHVETAGNEIRIDWRLPSALAAPALQLLILRRTARGIEADPRTIPLGA